MNQHDDNVVFREPWEAKVFALQQTLLEAGVFTAVEWSQRLGEELARHATNDGATYYTHWLSALETLVADKGVASRARCRQTALAWTRAARRTPHGARIRLTSSDFE